MFRTNVICDELTSAEGLYVVWVLNQSLLGWHTIKALNLLSAINSVEENFLTVFLG